MGETKSAVPSINCELLTAFEGDLTQNSSTLIYSLDLKDSATEWVIASGLKPTEIIYFSVSGEVELVRNFDMSS